MLGNFVQSFLQYLKNEEIRKKIYVSLLILLVFRVLAVVPVIGISTEALQSLFAGSSFGDLMSTLSGGVLETASVVAVGLSPYINASITLQLLTPVIPKLAELKKEGSQGRRMISMYTRFLTVPLAILQSFGIYSILVGYGLLTSVTPFEIAVMSATLTAGAIIVMWLGELVSEDGVGNGTSWIIFIGIISAVPGAVTSNWQYLDNLQKFLFIASNVLMILIVIIISEAERRVKIQYSRRVNSSSTGGDNFIPLKLTQSGVLPVIFAISFLSFPTLIARFLISRNFNAGITSFSENLISWIDNPWTQNLGLVILIIAFSLFYITIVFNTDEVAEDLQKKGGFIQGIRPGKSTSQYLRSVSMKLTIVGAIVLAFLSIVPNLFMYFGVFQSPLITGTGLLITVSVLLDIRRQIKAMSVSRDYSRYM